MAEPPLFEAVSTPHRSLHPFGFLVLAVLCLGWALIGGVVFLVVGAWPVVPFLGGEALLVLGAVLLHHRWSGRAREVISIRSGLLRVRRDRGRGKAFEATLDPYWARVERDDQRGLALVQRGRRVEIGRFLSEQEQADLAAALEAVLAAYRQPVFDNPQLREKG
ncbi:DUF2244 domain-containing protein [Pseudoroseomonas globiformis]|uniref:DUF2244 domain-containing protein n=1 Tax=Teichococcus globiformis TaxID=2307229 RepID=A0ABV7G231_9PROT